jgi:hypothetical protein
MRVEMGHIWHYRELPPAPWFGRGRKLYGEGEGMRGADEAKEKH